MNLRKIIMFVIFNTVIVLGQSGWVKQTSGTTENLIGVFFTDSNRGTVVGTNGTILKTTNGGSSWKKLSSDTTANLCDVFFTDSSNGLIVGGYVLLRTTNGGADWTKKSFGSFGKIHFIDINNGIIVGTEPFYAVIYRTSDGGLTWSKKLSYGPLGGSGDFPGVSFADSKTGMGVFWGSFTSQYYNLICRTTDGGYSWFYVNTPAYLTGSINGISCPNANTCIIVGYNGSIFRSTDGGTTWLKQNSGTNEFLNDIFFINTNNGTVIGANGTILHTTDGGDTWTKQNNISVTANLESIYFSDANNGTIVGYNGTILHTTTAGLTSVNGNDQRKFPSSFSLAQNYPNPFNPTTTINYSIPKSGFVTIKVYDALGKQVATLVNENKPAGNYNIKFDDSKLVSGVYFYRMEAGSFSQTKKLILLK